MIYLDNAATTHKKPLSVKLAVFKAITFFNANPGRGGHFLSVKAGEEVFKARTQINNFVNGFGEENIIFTYNCTDSLNLAILGGIPKASHVITSVFEHNSMLRPLKNLENNNLISLSIITPENKTNITLKDIIKEIKPTTKAVCLTHVSNLTGAEIDLKEIGTYLKSKKILFIVDAAQSAGHKLIDMKEFNIDALALAGHKGLYGTMGIGVLCFNPNNINIKPIRYGGTGTHSIELTQNFESPEVYESGTVNLSGIMALNAGIKFITKNFNKNINKTYKLSDYVLNNLNKNSYIIYTKNNNGVIAFNHKKLSSGEVAAKLNEKKICVRAGLHCAPLMHKYLGTQDSGVVRASIGYYNNLKQIKKFVKTLNEIT